MSSPVQRYVEKKAQETEVVNCKDIIQGARTNEEIRDAFIRIFQRHIQTLAITEPKQFYRLRYLPYGDNYYGAPIWRTDFEARTRKEAIFLARQWLLQNTQPEIDLFLCNAQTVFQRVEELWVQELSHALVSRNSIDLLLVQVDIIRSAASDKPNT